MPYGNHVLSISRTRERAPARDGPRAAASPPRREGDDDAGTPFPVRQVRLLDPNRSSTMPKFRLDWARAAAAAYDCTLYLA